jgi:hypothetical protein
MEQADLNEVAENLDIKYSVLNNLKDGKPILNRHQMAEHIVNRDD